MKNINKVHNLTGQRFGLLTVIGIDDRGTKKTYWMCQCDCGNVKSVRSDSLLSGAVKSCGCLKKKQDRLNLTANHSHKMSGTRIYHEWQGIKGRCFNKNDARYARYGGRGITVCDEWRNDFQSFYDWAMANGYSDNLTIDRKDNDGNYCPENCRWVDDQTQARNRSSNISITIGNSTRPLMEWCEIFGLDFQSTVARYHRNRTCGLEDLFNSGYKVNRS